MSSNILHVPGAESPAALGAATQADKNPFLLALGERVRALRARRGMTRKAVAQAAEVSERHLANLEYGEGNVSILLLLQVAQAVSPMLLVASSTRFLVEPAAAAVAVVRTSTVAPTCWRKTCRKACSIPPRTARH